MKTIRVRLVVPFLIILVITSFLIGAVSFYVAVRSITELSTDLADETAARINAYLTALLEEPHLVNRLNADDLAQGLLRPQLKDERERYFASRIAQFPNILYTFFGMPDGSFYGARRLPDGSLQIVRSDRGTGGDSHNFALLPDGTAGELLAVFPNFDPRRRPWYQAGLQTPGAGYGAPYRHFVIQDLALTASLPSYGPDGTLLGVFGADLTLSGIGAFLGSLQIGRSGAALIWEEPTGHLVASSSALPTFRRNGDLFERVAMSELEDATARTAFESRAERAAHEWFSLHGAWVKRANYTAYGLNWTIAVVVPFRDFLSSVRLNLVFGLLAQAIALIAAVAAGFATARSITDPILHLNDAARELSRGNWSAIPAADRNDEVGQLGASFAFMAHQLRELVEHLEEKVQERTADLEAGRELAQAAARAKSEFLANMSHEIRTPLNAVLGFAEILLRDEPDPDRKEYLTNIATGGRALLRIINDVLDLSKMEARKIELDPHPADIDLLMRQVFGMFALQVKEKGLSLVFKPDLRMPKLLLLDEIRVRQILFNLIGNAIKFSEAGSIEITTFIEHDVRDVDGDRRVDLSISIRDTGPGISASDVERIFEPFVQGGAPGARRSGGTGLGLTISRRFAELMGGTIRVQSEPGVGSTFTVELPAVPVFEDEIQPAQAEDLSGVRFESPLVLVADDDQPSRQLLRELLVPHRVRVFEADNGRMVIEQLAVQPVDAVLMNISMPHLDGTETARILKRNPAYASIPIIAVTGRVLEDERATIVEAGFDAFLRKPIEPSELVRALMGFLPHRFERQSDRRADQRGERARGAMPAAGIDARAGETKPAGGSTLPDGATANDPRVTGAGSPASAPARPVYVVENEALARKLFMVMIQQSGYECRVFSSAADVIGAARTTTPVLLICDYNLEGTTGEEVARILRAAFAAGLAEFPIIATSASMPAHIGSAQWDRLFDGFIEKPINTEVLMRTIARFS